MPNYPKTNQTVTMLLRACCRIEPNTNSSRRIHDLAVAATDWVTVVNEAERHAIAPMVYHAIKNSGYAMPLQAKRQLYALIQRHTWANETRTEVLGEIIDACGRKHIDIVILKGAYLAHTISPDPSWRPMSDIDVLAAPSQVTEVQKTLQEMGFSIPESNSSRYMSSHHHLPCATLLRNGLNVAVEVHHDALSGDANASITTENLTMPLRQISIAGRQTYALGHQDQLRHLYHHMSEPAQLLKLVWCNDIARYAWHFRQDLIWPDLNKKYPAVVIAIRLVALVCPLPEGLDPFIPKTNKVNMTGIGESIKPLTSILKNPPGKRFSLLLNPSEWWLRLFYGIAPEKPITVARWIRHPWQVQSWILRRLACGISGKG